ncbi:hypothetical protein M408DRAFT_5359 [Serendipita vermifera MAFF 305830]|uniref:F-box domain-containing protein n=1 Tax=Serendipita vermifera MAFF 305830 TaxID=933852 RepID=A0A0C3BAU9_SERVB|nr:hypothetical protein M408DRAFT_5359 [Serendipita vermifera MAFF 305830]
MVSLSVAVTGNHPLHHPCLFATLTHSFPTGRILHLDMLPNPAQRSIAEDSILAKQNQLSALDFQVAAAYAAVSAAHSAVLAAHSVVSVAHSAVSAAYATVLAAQEHHRELLSQRTVLCAQICRDKNRLQPALCLPSKALAEIFAYCVDEDTHAMWKVSSVCFDWRVTALEHSRLWCRIVVPSHLPSPVQFRITHLWVARTGMVDGLDIRYRVVDDTPNYSTYIVEETMTLLASKISRWQHFDLETNLDDCVHICARLAVGGAPNLETFLVRKSEDLAIRHNRRLPLCKTLTLGPAPKLKHVVLYTSAWPTATFLHGLTTLTLVSGRVKRMVDLWRVLDGCENLERLTLRLPVDHEFDPPGRSRTTLLRLERLRSLSGNAMVLALLPFLLVPSLDTLQVNDVDAFILMRTLNTLDLRSNPPLQILQLHNSRLVSGTTGLSLKSIKRLEFYDSEVEDSFFYSLSMPTAGTSSWIRPYRTWALPSLEVIVLRRSHYVREQALRRLVEVRNPTTPNAMCPAGTPAVGLPARVKVVDVKDCRRVGVEFAGWIHERLSRGPDRTHIPRALASGERLRTTDGVHHHATKGALVTETSRLPSIPPDVSPDPLEDQWEILAVDTNPDLV